MGSHWPEVLKTTNCGPGLELHPGGGPPASALRGESRTDAGKPVASILSPIAPLPRRVATSASRRVIFDVVRSLRSELMSETDRDGGWGHARRDERRPERARRCR